MAIGCSSCGSSVPPGAANCPRCGRPYWDPTVDSGLELDLPAAPAPAPTPAPTIEPAAAAASAGETCPSCGAAVPNDFAECPRCRVIIAKAKQVRARPVEAAASAPVESAVIVPVVPHALLENETPNEMLGKEVRLYLLDWAVFSLFLVWALRKDPDGLVVVPVIAVLFGLLFGLSIIRRIIWEQVAGNTGAIILLLFVCGWNWVLLALIGSSVSFVNRLVHDLAPKAFAWRPVAITTGAILVLTLAIGIHARKYEPLPTKDRSAAAQPAAPTAAEQSPTPIPTPAPAPAPAVEPAPPSVTLVPVHVESKPAGAAITIDGDPTGKRTPADVMLLNSSGHELGFTLDGHAPMHKHVGTPPEPQVMVELTLQFRLHVDTEPAGAAISIDRKDVGKSPGDFDVTPGTRHLTARLEGWIPVEIDRDVGEDAKAWTVKLEQSALVKITCNVEGAEIVVDGKKTGQLTPTAPLDLPPGPHSIEALQGKLKSGKQKIKATRGRTVSVSLKIVDFEKQRREERRHRLEAESKRLELAIQNVDKFFVDDKSEKKIAKLKQQQQAVEAQLSALDDEESRAGANP